MTRKQAIQKALNELEKAGIVERNGLFRGGQPVYVLTKFSAKLEDTNKTDYNAANFFLRQRAKGGHYPIAPMQPRSLHATRASRPTPDLVGL